MQLKNQFLGRLDNNQGQTLITWLLLLTMLLGILLGTTSAFVLIQNRMQVMTTCRLGNLKTQSQVEPLAKKLFGLNPRAQLLRLQLFSAQARLALAIAHYNFPLMAQSKAEIARIRQQQKILDQVQKGLIKTANTLLHSGTISTYLMLQKTFQEIRSKNSTWADVQFQLHNPKIPKLAVTPEDYDLAPTYYEKENFEKVQSSSHSWTQNYAANGFFKFRHQSKSECQATLSEGTWLPKIRRDRLLLR